jgi:hypothetical protein
MQILLEDKTLAEKIAHVDAVECVVSSGDHYGYDAFHNVTITEDGLEFDVDFYIGDPYEVNWDRTKLDTETVRFRFDEFDLELIKESSNSNKELDQTVHKLFTTYIDNLNKELSALIGEGYVDFQTMIHYNGYAEVIRSWKTLETRDGWQIACPENYNASSSVKRGDSDWGILQFIWGTAVYKFGDYGTSPRCGWIDIREHPEFYEWIDAICLDDIKYSFKTSDFTDEFIKAVKNLRLNNNKTNMN